MSGRCWARCWPAPEAVDTLVTALDGRELLLSITGAPILDPEGR